MRARSRESHTTLFKHAICRAPIGFPSKGARCFNFNFAQPWRPLVDAVLQGSVKTGAITPRSIHHSRNSLRMSRGQGSSTATHRLMHHTYPRRRNTTGRNCWGQLTSAKAQVVLRLTFPLLAGSRQVVTPSAKSFRQTISAPVRLAVTRFFYGLS